MNFSQLGSLNRGHSGFSILPMVWDQNRLVFSNVGIGALIGEGMVHPLGKETAMNRHLPPMEVGHFSQARLESLAQGPWGRHCVGGHVCNQLQNPHGLSHGRLQLGLQLTHEVFTLISTANGIQARSFQAIGPSHHVVGHNHLRLLRIRVVQSAQTSQVVCLLSKSPMAVQGLFVESGETDSSCLLAFHILHSGFQSTTFSIIEVEIPLTNLLHQVKVGTKAWRGRQTLIVLLLQISKPIVCILPIGISPGEDGLLGMHLLWRSS
mmetsp:Transcript_70072/g.85977  ORF Transcript_70072/g.85977 Transcript_70072/m.85977 type:complete len:265 (+) Transcript_70072:248-1042(+)